MSEVKREMVDSTQFCLELNSKLLAETPPGQLSVGQISRQVRNMAKDLEDDVKKLPQEQFSKVSTLLKNAALIEDQELVRQLAEIYADACKTAPKTVAKQLRALGAYLTDSTVPDETKKTIQVAKDRFEAKHYVEKELKSFVLKFVEEFKKMISDLASESADQALSTSIHAIVSRFLQEVNKFLREVDKEIMSSATVQSLYPPLFQASEIMTNSLVRLLVSPEVKPKVERLNSALKQFEEQLVRIMNIPGYPRNH